MTSNRYIAFLMVSHFACLGFATEPTQIDARLLKAICGGQWIIDEDRHRMVETRVEAGDIVRSRSWMLDNSFKRIVREEAYRYDSDRKKLTATIVWSNGNKWVCAGTWDDDAKTLTWTAPHNSGIRSFSLRIVTPKIVEYKIYDTDKSGQLGWEYSEKRYLLGE